MRCSLKFLVPVMILAAPVAVLAAQRTFPNVGTPLSQAEIQNFDHMIGPEGKELPVGRGTSKEGADDLCAALRGLPREEWRKRDNPPSGGGQSRQAFPRSFLWCGKGRSKLLPVSDDRVGLYQPRDARQQSGIAQAERSLRAGRVPVLPQRHHQRKRRDGREDSAEGRKCRTRMASFRQSRSIRRQRTPAGTERERPKGIGLTRRCP